MVTKFGMGKAAAVRLPIGGEKEAEKPGKLLPSGGAGSSSHPIVQTFQSLVGSSLWIGVLLLYIGGRGTRTHREKPIGKLEKKIAK
ncbi:hypothetical protein P3T76_013718 [Phytophthora citrophthora]|uniref:Uncharacterized protein n=1 Tax=Phytophthora citrophthora TaxID=4793 RepID=A0AAD9G2W2_9STRA|nr:hypothetical protein P3T76_013718 [Phytophthora citrophthora]